MQKDVRPRVFGFVPRRRPPPPPPPTPPTLPSSTASSPSSSHFHRHRHRRRRRLHRSTWCLSWRLSGVVVAHCGHVLSLSMFSMLFLHVRSRPIDVTICAATGNPTQDRPLKPEPGSGSDQDRSGSRTLNYGGRLYRRLGREHPLSMESAEALPKVKVASHA